MLDESLYVESTVESVVEDKVEPVSTNDISNTNKFSIEQMNNIITEQVSKPVSKPDMPKKPLSKRSNTTKKANIEDIY